MPDDKDAQRAEAMAVLKRKLTPEAYQRIADEDLDPEAVLRALDWSSSA